MKQIACIGIGFVLVLSFFGLTAAAQNQAPSNNQTPSSDSLGAYAKQVRKDPSAKAKPKVFDNDNLPKDDKLSVVGPAPAATTENAPEAKSAAPTPATGTTAESKTETKASTTADSKTQKASEKAPEPDEATKQAAAKQWNDKVAAEKEKIDLLERELNVLQREYQIRAAAMYADAGNRMRNAADWDKQDTQYKQQIADKQKAVDDEKQKLEDIQEEARKAGVTVSVQ